MVGETAILWNNYIVSWSCVLIAIEELKAKVMKNEFNWNSRSEKKFNDVCPAIFFPIFGLLWRESIFVKVVQSFSYQTAFHNEYGDLFSWFSADLFLQHLKEDMVVKVNFRDNVCISLLRWHRMILVNLVGRSRVAAYTWNPLWKRGLDKCFFGLMSFPK